MTLKTLVVWLSVVCNSFQCLVTGKYHGVGHCWASRGQGSTSEGSSLGLMVLLSVLEAMSASTSEAGVLSHIV